MGSSPFSKPSSVRRTWALTVWAMLAVTPTLGAAVRVSGTSIELDPPPGFVAQERYPGFQHPDTGASIMVTEVPGPLSGVTGGFTQEGLASRGMKLLSVEDLPLDSLSGLIAHIEQAAGGVTWHKWIRAFGTESATTLIVSMYPADEGEALAATMRRAALSAHPATESAPRDEGLLYKVDESEDLVVIHRVGNLQMLAPPGSTIPVANDRPVLIVGSSIAPATRPSLERFAHERVQQIEQIEGLGDISGAPLEVGGLSSYEFTAAGKDPDTDEAMGLYQLVIDEGGHYHIAIGLVTLEHFGEHLAAFKKVARSLRLR